MSFLIDSAMAESSKCRVSFPELELQDIESEEESFYEITSSEAETSYSTSGEDAE